MNKLNKLILKTADGTSPCRPILYQYEVHAEHLVEIFPFFLLVFKSFHIFLHYDFVEQFLPL